MEDFAEQGLFRRVREVKRELEPFERRVNRDRGGLLDLMEEV